MFNVVGLPDKAVSEARERMRDVLGVSDVRTNAQAQSALLEEVARTLADLDGGDNIGHVHLAEALSYRALGDEVRRAA